MPILDIFRDDAFGVTSLTDSINAVNFVPGRIGELGLFEETGVSTISVVIEQKSGLLSLVSPSPRGGVGDTSDKEKRTARSFLIPHFQRNDAIMADEVQGVRAWGSESEVEMAAAKVMERAGMHGRSLEATLEHARVGAIKGIVTYADASTLDLFTEFGVLQESEVNFDLSNLALGLLRKKCGSVVRSVANTLDGAPFTGLRAFCGDNFFDDLLANAEVRGTFEGWSEAKILREGYIETNGKSYGAFEFGGIVWENYRGSTGGTAFVDTNKCHIFPVGVPGLFRTYFGPADYWETVNKPGQRMYVQPTLMPNNKGVALEVQMNALNICTRPKALIKGKRT